MSRCGRAAGTSASVSRTSYPTNNTHQPIEGVRLVSIYSTVFRFFPQRRLGSSSFGVTTHHSSEFCSRSGKPKFPKPNVHYGSNNSSHHDAEAEVRSEGLWEGVYGPRGEVRLPSRSANLSRGTERCVLSRDGNLLSQRIKSTFHFQDKEGDEGDGGEEEEEETLTC